MKSSLFATLAISLLIGGCARPTKPQPQNGVNVSAPGVRVHVGEGGTQVTAPGVNVDTGSNGTEVRAPGVDVRTNE